MNFTRYALYFTPAPGPLADFGAAWLGWDAVIGTTLSPPNIPELPLPWEEITSTPRKYGFHGTIKPPFRLADGQSTDSLRNSLAEFCLNRAPVVLDGMELAQLGRFLALVPVGNTAALNSLAADAVRSFNPFRAPLSDAELARRRESNLSPRQDALLEAWGYPYVMEEFRFHLTLTGKLPKAKATSVGAVLRPLVTPLLPLPFVIDALSLMGEGPDGRFHLIARHDLTGAS